MEVAPRVRAVELGHGTVGLPTTGPERSADQLAVAAASGDRVVLDRIAVQLGGLRLDRVLSGWDDMPAACLIDVDDRFLSDLDASTTVDRILLGTDAVLPRFRIADGSGRNPLPQQDEVVRAGNGVQLTQVSPVGVVDLLRSGGTAILNDIGPSAAGPLQRFCHDTGRIAAVRTQVNLYLSEREATGFGRHWDDHDVLIIQCHGRKRWELFEPTVPFAKLPWVPRREFGKPVVSTVLEPGQGIFIPHGWGHEVRGFEGQISLHYTVGFSRMTGLDVVASVARSDASAERANPVDLELDPSLSVRGIDESAVEQATAMWRFSVPLYPAIGPIETANAFAADLDGYAIEVPLPGGFVHVDHPAVGRGEQAFGTAEKVVIVPAPLVPAVALLLGGAPCTVAQLASLIDGGGDAGLRLAEDLLRAEVATLRRAG